MLTTGGMTGRLDKLERAGLSVQTEALSTLTEERADQLADLLRELPAGRKKRENTSRASAAPAVRCGRRPR